MNSELLLGIRSTPLEKMTVIKLNHINLQEKVKKLRTDTAVQANLSNDSFDLIYCGCVLENESTLESYGLKSGSMVHVLKKKESKDAATPGATASGSETNIDTLTSVFKSFIGNPLRELALRRLTKRPDFIENIISSSPGLSEDAVAIAILQDPDLISHCTNAETIQKMAKLHPALVEAAQHIASAVHDEAYYFALSFNPTDNLSEDEEMAADSSQSSDSTQPSNSTGNSRNPNSSATAARERMYRLSSQRRSRRSTSGASSTGNASSPMSSIPRTNSNSGGVITFEMFSQAMQQAFASSPAMNDLANPAQSPSPSPSASFIAPQSSSTTDMQRQITIMHEMGLQNDAVNLQALQITNGDVQAAIELVLSGFGDN